MKFFSGLFAPRNSAPPMRRRWDVETVRTLLEHTLQGATQPNFKAFWSKELMAAVTPADIEEASKKSFSPWAKNRWECKDQARSLVEAAQRKAANEGCTFALGILFADPPTPSFDASRHVYVWAVIGSVIAFFDPTARKWCERPANIYFSLA